VCALRSRALTQLTPRAVTWANREGAVRVGDHGLDGQRLLCARRARPESASAEKYAR
jgi:hypothetical protein